MDSKMSQHRKGPRRRHSAEFKREVVNACSVPGASVAGVALSFGVNANLVRQWLKGRGFKQLGVAPVAVPRPQRFLPVSIPAVVAARPDASSPAGAIQVHVRRGTLQVNVSWPQSTAADCAAWLSEFLR
jgi:transposase